MKLTISEAKNILVHETKFEWNGSKNLIKYEPNTRIIRQQILKYFREHSLTNLLKEL